MFKQIFHAILDYSFTKSEELHKLLYCPQSPDDKKHSKQPNTTFNSLISNLRKLELDSDEDNSALKNLIEDAMRCIDLKTPPGLAGDICENLAFFEKRFLSETRPIAALAVIARLSAHRKILGNQKVSFLALVSAESAIGKEAQQEYQKLLLSAVGVGDSVVGEPRSDKQMIEALAEYEHLIYILDEVHGMFDKTSSKSSSSHEKAILNMILTLSTTAIYHFPPKIKKDLIAKCESEIQSLKTGEISESKQKTLDQKMVIMDYLQNGWKNPFLSVVGYSTPINLDSLINMQNIQSGLLGRFLFIRVFSRDKLNLTPYSDGPSEKLVERCHSLKNLEGGIRISDDANILLNYIIFYYELDEHRNHPLLGAIYARGVEHVKRIASLLAMETSLITPEMLMYAMRIFQENLDSCSQLVDKKAFIKQDEIERLGEGVIQRIRVGDVKAGVLANNIVKCSSWVREERKKTSRFEYEVLAELVSQGIICYSDISRSYSVPAVD